VTWALNPETLTVFFGLASALTWGAGDFCGGLATRKSNVLSVVLVSQIVGGTFLAILALIFQEALPSLDSMLFGSLAGLAGAVGLIGLYSGLAQGRMGIVAPLTAVLAATLPILFGLLTEGFPPILNVAGFGLALVAVWFLAGVGRSTAVSRTELGYALLAGTGFALFFIFIDQATDELVFWPLVAARIASVVCLGLLVLMRRSWQRPPRDQLPIIFLTGIFDALGNAFFAAAARVGRLDIAAVLASLYPVSTVLLAQLVLHERLNRSQWIGVGLALLALVLITA
jgi:uncharacterized membrane protein